MSKLIRFDEDHFGYLFDGDITRELARLMDDQFTSAFPGKRLIIMQADEFIDLTGKYEIVPIVDDSPASVNILHPETAVV